MKKLSLLIVLLFSAVCGFAQTTDSVKIAVKPKSLTQEQRDSLQTNIHDDLSYISNGFYDVKKYAIRSNKSVGRYKVYRTTNLYNSLKLDTASGRVTALQISVGDSKVRMEYEICDALETDYDYQIVGRYELYPTSNNYNFILIDTMYGYAYQVQWSTKNEECGRWGIY